MSGRVLHLAKGLDLPIDIAAQTVAVLGIRAALRSQPESYTARQRRLLDEAGARLADARSQPEGKEPRASASSPPDGWKPSACPTCQQSLPNGAIVPDSTLSPDPAVSICSAHQTYEPSCRICNHLTSQPEREDKLCEDICRTPFEAFGHNEFCEKWQELPDRFVLDHKTACTCGGVESHPDGPEASAARREAANPPAKQCCNTYVRPDNGKLDSCDQPDGHTGDCGAALASPHENCWRSNLGVADDRLAKD